MFIELTLVSIALSVFSIYSNDNKKEIEAVREENNQLKINYNKKLSTINQKLNNSEARASDFAEMLRNSENQYREFEDKLYDIQNRWDIISDSRITSFPQTKEQWKEAKDIVAQPITKLWKPQRLSQTKASMLVNSDNYEPTEEEMNQDFSNFDESDLAEILQEDDGSSSSSGSGSASSINIAKPKPKNSQPKMM